MPRIDADIVADMCMSPLSILPNRHGYAYSGEHVMNDSTPHFMDFRLYCDARGESQPVGANLAGIENARRVQNIVRHE